MRNWLFNSLCYKWQTGLLSDCKVVGEIMSNNFAHTCYKISIQCIILKFTVNSRACNAQLVHYFSNGNTTVFNGFEQYFALVRHKCSVTNWLYKDVIRRMIKQVNYPKSDKIAST